MVQDLSIGHLHIWRWRWDVKGGVTTQDSMRFWVGNPGIAKKKT